MSPTTRLLTKLSKAAPPSTTKPAGVTSPKSLPRSPVRRLPQDSTPLQHRNRRVFQPRRTRPISRRCCKRIRSSGNSSKRVRIRAPSNSQAPTVKSKSRLFLRRRHRELGSGTSLKTTGPQTTISKEWRRLLCRISDLTS